MVDEIVLSPRQGFWYFAQSRSCEIQVNPKCCEIVRKPNLSWNFVTETCKQCPKTSRNRLSCKNWALAMMLKALPLVHLWSVLLLKEQMMTSVREMLKTLVWSAQNRSISCEICPENNHKISHFLLIAFWQSLPLISANFSLKSRKNLTFFPRPIRSPSRSDVTGASKCCFHSKCYSFNVFKTAVLTHI